jgi:hypothetical protein
MFKFLLWLYRVTLGGFLAGVAFVWREWGWPTVAGWLVVALMLGVHGYLWLLLVAALGLNQLVALMAFVTAAVSITGVAATNTVPWVDTAIRYACDVITKGYADRCHTATYPADPRHALAPKRTGASADEK